MTVPTRYRGQPVSEGIGLGQIYHGDSAITENGHRRPATEDEVRAAFAAVARDRAALATDLREKGQDQQAAIVDIAALIAADSALITPAVEAVRAGADGADAIRQAGEVQAALLAALPDPDLAQRAGDVRQVAQAVADHLGDKKAAPPPAATFILVRREVDPADLIRLAEAGLAGAVSVGGGASSHAAIIARGLGLPMLAGADPMVLKTPTGHQAILNSAQGELIVDPAAPELAAAQTATARMATTRTRSAARDLTMADGRPVTLLCNVASAAETRLGLSGGATGVGLLRTEIAFTTVADWPSPADHLAQLTPILSQLHNRPAVVRLLDFSGDKVPPFLKHQKEQGLTALLNAPEALRDQLTAILRAGHGTRLSVLVPMVRSLDEVAAVRAALADAAAEAGLVPPKLGIMVEVAATAANAAAFAPVVDFFSIGTNDLTSEVLGLDRADQGTNPALAADPRVQSHIQRTVNAAAEAGINVSVCGDAAADPLVLPLLLGQGIRTLSVGAARVPQVARQIMDTRVARLWRPVPAQLSADRTTPPRPAPRSRDTARAAPSTSRTSSSRAPGASSRSAAPTTPIAPATTPSRDTMGAAIPASPTVASWSSTA
jgi:phosphoenolpyruvate-protein kinase (PTS system EI component)